MPTFTRDIHSVRTLARGVAAVAALATLATACSDDAEVLKPTASARILDRYVALGNSITAGYQSGGINDSTQRESYARLLAQQAGTGYVYASLPATCAPPIASFQTGARVNAPGACGLPVSYPYLNNVAVPGAVAADFATPYTASYSALTSFILGGKSQWRRAMDVNPTFATVWLGNNDVLAAGASGVLTPTAGVSPGITPVNTFISQYKAGADSLGARVPKGVLIGVVNVAGIPLLFPAESLLSNPTFKAQFDAARGGTTTVLPNCLGSRALVSLAALQSAAGRAAVATISCVKNQPVNGAGETFILDATEQSTLLTTVTAYNAYIKAKADTMGYAYVDPNPVLASLKASGKIPPLPIFTSAQPFGPYISLDGVHPAAPAHQLFANLLIDAINAKYGTSIPKLAVPTV